jgi:tRNA G18 (ribose-2'-O)-methylase SpoU
MKNKNSVLILENIRSAQNVGALFRTADAVGISKIYIVGYTPDPVDRFGRDRNDIAKSALGAEKSVAWEHVAEIVPLLEKLKKDGYKIISIEQAKNSVDYKKVKIGDKTAFVLGNEVEGVSAEALMASDTIAEIPMRGKKESLNVSVAGGIALFRILDK